jgi:hypothetical protein
MRHLAIGGGTVNMLEDLAGPMSSVLDYFVAMQKQNLRYQAKYGDLSSTASNNSNENGSEDDGSETEQE